MKISTILDHIDNGHMALPEFQRGYVRNRDQVRGLLVWATELNFAAATPGPSSKYSFSNCLLAGRA